MPSESAMASPPFSAVTETAPDIRLDVAGEEAAGLRPARGIVLGLLISGVAWFGLFWLMHLAFR